MKIRFYNIMRWKEKNMSYENLEEVRIFLCFYVKHYVTNMSWAKSCP